MSPSSYQQHIDTQLFQKPLHNPAQPSLHPPNATAPSPRIIPN